MQTGRTDAAANERERNMNTERKRLEETYPAGTNVCLAGGVTGRIDYWGNRAGKGVVAVVFVDCEHAYGHIEVAAANIEAACKQ